MLDHDISTADALRHLSTDEDAFADAHAIDRRRFLQLVGMGMGAGMVAGPGSSLLDSALTGGDTSWAAGPIGATDGVLVIIGMFGGNDGLNTVVPINDGRYYDQHGDLAIPPSQTLSLNSSTGLNQNLTVLKQFWDTGKLAIVEGVGYPNPDLSHFNSMAKWMSGKPTGIPTSGWVGRWLDGYLNGSKDLFAAAEVGHSLPLHMIGQASRATSIPANRPSFGARDGERYQRQYATVRRMGTSGAGLWHREVGQAFADQLDVAKTIAPSIPEELPDVDLVARLEVAARLINANLGFRVLTAGWGDFDSHAGQPSQHPARMQELNAAIGRFYQILNPTWSTRVTFMTFSEFGRTSFSNDGAGTDHGTSAPHFVFGSNVRGGMYGQRPTLRNLERWDRMAHHVDFRDYYGSVLDGWMGGGGSDVLGKSISNLGLFTRGPGGDAPPITVDPKVTGDPVPKQLTNYTPILPQRIVDTREDIGGHKRKLEPGETMVVGTAGVKGLPSSGVQSVMVNVTATEASRETYFMLYPRGGVKPREASSLNPSARRDSSNSVITAVNKSGEFVIYNHNAFTHCVVDITGYCSAAGDLKFTSIEPARLLDTRNTIGGPAAPLLGGRSVDLDVLNRGGVPKTGVDSVVLNITTVDANARGFVTVHSTDVKRPWVSNANYTPGHIISNSMTCKVGSDGKVSIFVNAGALNMVVDVVGYFSADGTRLQVTAPSRILDTREGNGAPQRRMRARETLDLTVNGRGGVPNNASSVVLNLTAVSPTAPGYITAYPDGVSRKETSSVNMIAGETLANLVIAKIGPAGTVRLYNHAGDVDLVADVTGYFV